MQEHTFLAHLSFFTMSIFIHFILDDSWIWHFNSRFQSAALNKVENLFLKTDFLWTYLIPRVNTVFLQFDWVQASLIPLPPPRSIVPSSPLNLPLQLNEVGPLPLISFIALERLFMFDLIASDVYEFTFDLPSQKGASPGGCVFIWLAYLIHAKGEGCVCNRLSWTKKWSSTATDSQQNREYLIFNWFLFRERSPKAFFEIVCQVEWNVTRSIWPHYWILQKTHLRAQIWCETYFDSKLSLSVAFAFDQASFSLNLFTLDQWLNLAGVNSGLKPCLFKYEASCLL